LRQPALLIVLAALALAGCGKSADDPGKGGLTASEAKALDEAAEMLDAQRLPPAAAASTSPTAPAAKP